MTLNRIKELSEISIRNRYYLHYKPLQNDLRYYIDKYCTAGIVLDVGAGNQPYRKLFGDTVKYIAVDIDKANSDLDIVADNRSIPVKNESIDFVVCTQVLEHVSEPSKLFAEVNRVLKSRGLFLLTCPMNWEIHERPYDYYRYTYYGIDYLASTAGFRLLEYNEQGGAFAVAGQTILNNKKLPLRELITPIVNVTFGWLDKVWYDPDSTINYIFMFQK